MSDAFASDITDLAVFDAVNIVGTIQEFLDAVAARLIPDMDGGAVIDGCAVIPVGKIDLEIIGHEKKKADIAPGL